MLRRWAALCGVTVCLSSGIVNSQEQAGERKEPRVVDPADAGAAPGPIQQTSAAVAKSLVERTNAYRTEQGLETLETDQQLDKAADQFARYMADNGKYGHRADGRTPAQRAAAAGYDYCIVRENIAYRMNTGDPTVESLSEVFMQGWIDSPPHRENLQAPDVTDIGIGVASADGETFYAVQMFARPQSASFEIVITNNTAEEVTLLIGEDEQRQQLAMPPRTRLQTTRCTSVEIRLQAAGEDGGLQISENAELEITEKGLVRREAGEKTSNGGRKSTSKRRE